MKWNANLWLFFPSQTQNHNHHASTMLVRRLVLDQRELNTHLPPPTPVCLCTGLPEWPTEGPASCDFPLTCGFQWVKLKERRWQSRPLFLIWWVNFFFFFFLPRFPDEHKVSSFPGFISPRRRWLLHDTCVTIKGKQKHIQSKLCGRTGCPFQLTLCPIQSRLILQGDAPRIRAYYIRFSIKVCQREHILLCISQMQ